MFADMTVIECTITNFLRFIDGVVDVVNSMSEFIANAHFPFPFLTLFD